MLAELKQAEMTKLIHSIYPDMEIQYSISRRAKRVLGTCYWWKNLLRFHRPLWKYDLFSCLYCALHEVAHYMQREISGYTKHDFQFREILDMLIEDYGNEDIRKAKKNTALSWSDYSLDPEFDYEQLKGTK